VRNSFRTAQKVTHLTFSSAAGIAIVAPPPNPGFGLLLSLLLSYSAFAAYGPDLEGDLLAEGASSEPADTGVVGCSDQYLKDGVLLPDLPLFLTRVQPGHAWGTREMTDLLVDTSRHMRWLMPEADPISIGEISAEHGGFLQGHKSHRGGVDADVGLYMTGGHQNPRQFDTPGPGQFDVEANWMLMASFLESGKVDMILLDRGLIAKLKAYTLQAGLLSEEEANAIFLGEAREGYQSVGVVRHAPSHEDHMHVRVLCPDGSKASAR